MGWATSQASLKHQRDCLWQDKFVLNLSEGGCNNMCFEDHLRILTQICFKSRSTLSSFLFETHCLTIFKCLFTNSITVKLVLIKHKNADDKILSEKF